MHAPFHTVGFSESGTPHIEIAQQEASGGGCEAQTAPTIAEIL